MNYEHRNTTEQTQNEQQSTQDYLSELQRELRKRIPYERCIAETRRLTMAGNKRIRRQALELLRRLDESQVLNTEGSAGEKAESDAHPGRGSEDSGRVTVEKGAR